MKKAAVFCFVLIAVIMLISSCSPVPGKPALTPEPTVKTSATAQTVAPTTSPEVTPSPTTGGVINVYWFSREVPNIINRYIALHPDFPYTISWPDGMDDSLYEPALDYALAAGGEGAPDIYLAEAAFVTKYTQGEMSSYALPYEDLGLNVGSAIKAADIASYIVDIGTRPSDGKVVSLAYQSTGGAFIYRRSIAKDVWGTDDPAVIADKIGPGWDKFFEAAEALKKKGYSIVSGDGDIWHGVESSSVKGWLVDGKLYIDPKREAFLDYSKLFTDNGYSNGTKDWTDEWYADMSGSGKREVFGFLGPAWLINYVMAGHSGAEFNENGKVDASDGTWGDWAICEPPVNFFWGGIWVLANKNLENDPAKKAAVAELIDWIMLQYGEDSLQYAYANGMIDYGYGESGKKDTSASCSVMAMSDGKLDFLGGQNMFEVYIPASRNINGKNITPYDQSINSIWREQVRRYAEGECTREEAIAAFKQGVKEQLGIDAM